MLNCVSVNMLEPIATSRAQLESCNRYLNQTPWCYNIRFPVWQPINTTSNVQHQSKYEWNISQEQSPTIGCMFPYVDMNLATPRNCDGTSTAGIVKMGFRFGNDDIESGFSHIPPPCTYASSHVSTNEFESESSGGKFFGFSQFVRRDETLFYCDTPHLGTSDSSKLHAVKYTVPWAYHTMPTISQEIPSPNCSIKHLSSSKNTQVLNWTRHFTKNSSLSKRNISKGNLLGADSSGVNPRFKTRRNYINRRLTPIRPNKHSIIESPGRDLRRTHHTKPGSITKFLRNVLVKCELFNNALSDGYAIDAVIKEMYAQDLVENEIFVRQGDVGDAFFLLQWGVLDVLVKQKDVEGEKSKTIKVAVIKAGQTVGEAALMYTTKRTATLKATEATRIWIINAEQFRKIRQTLKLLNKKKIEEQQSFLSKISVFSKLKPRELMNLTQACHEVKYSPGEIIISETDIEDNDMYIIKEGRALMIKDRKNKAACQDMEIGSGDFFMRQMHKDEDFSSVKASSKVLCLRIRKDDFNFIVPPHRVSLSTTENVEYSDHGHEELPSEIENRVSWGLEDFIPLAIAGVGSFGHVVLVKVESGDTKYVYALKLVAKNKVIKMGQSEHMKNERRVMFMLDSPFIVKLFATYQDKTCVYFLQEGVLGGELFTLLRRKKSFTESTARFYFSCIVLALEHMHSLDIIYRDLKPENLLISAKGFIKVTDFGFAKRRNQSTSLCGTREYLAPELITKGIQNFGVDWWCAGIFLYEMLLGRVPFRDSENLKLYEDILVSDPIFPNWVTVEAQKLIHKLLEKNSFRRLGSGPRGAADVKQQNWFKLKFKEDVESFDWNCLAACKLKAPYEPELVSDEDCRHFQVLSHPKAEPSIPNYNYDQSLYDWCREF